MNRKTSPQVLKPWSFASPETFELTLRRIMEPSAEDKMKAALDEVTAQIEAAEKSPQAKMRADFHQAQRLKKRQQRLERRLEKLRTLKNMAIGPLIGGLLFGGLIWLMGLATASTAGYSIQQALAADMAMIEENQSTSLEITELDEDIHAGQLMGVPPSLSDQLGDYSGYEGEYPEPEYLLQVTNWTTQLDGCDELLATTTNVGEVTNCEAAARIDLVNQENPEITESCLFLQLGPEGELSFTAEDQKAWARANDLRSAVELKSNPRFYTAGEPDSWNSTTLLSCQVFGTSDETLVKEMVYIVGQLAYRINSGAYLAGGIFTWLEDDGSYAPRSQWDGHGPSDEDELAY